MRQSQLSPLEGPGDDRIFLEDGSVSGGESEGEGNGSQVKVKEEAGVVCHLSNSREFLKLLNIYDSKALVTLND